MRTTGANRHRWSRLVAVGAAALLAAACTSPSTPPAGPAKPAQWFTNFAEAERQGLSNLFAFYTPNVTLDYRTLAGYPTAVAGYRGTGRAAALSYLTTVWDPPSRRRLPVGPVYLSATGAVNPVRWTVQANTSNQTGPVDAVLLDTLTPAGISAETLATSEAAGRRFQPQYGHWNDWHRRVSGYLTAWTTGDAADVTTRYAPTATVEDTLPGLRLTGATAIGAAATGPAGHGGLRGASLDAISDFGGPAIYGRTDLTSPTTAATPIELTVVLLTVDDGHGCPDHLAVVLRTDPTGLITSEQRYHRADTLTQCTPGRALPAGWWDHLSVPAPVSGPLTGTVGTREAQIWNGTPGLQQLLSWAYDRYTAVPLSTDTVDRITFVPPAADACDGLLGMNLGSEINLCFDAHTACLDSTCHRWQTWAKETVLHEFAHAWIATNLDPTTRTAFLARTHLTTWDSGHAPWADRGVEWAAETIAWGLMDEPYHSYSKLHLPSCTERTALFQLLTNGSEPISPPC